MRCSCIQEAPELTQDVPRNGSSAQQPICMLARFVLPNLPLQWRLDAHFQDNGESVAYTSTFLSRRRS
jgi:hypothetical protein